MNKKEYNKKCDNFIDICMECHRSIIHNKEIEE